MSSSNLISTVDIWKLSNIYAFQRTAYPLKIEWRRLNRLAELSEQEYKSRLGDLLAENEDYKRTYDVESPNDIDPLEYAEYGDPEQVWLDITNWEAVRQEIHDFRRVNRGNATDEGVV